MGKQKGLSNRITEEEDGEVSGDRTSNSSARKRSTSSDRRRSSARKPQPPPSRQPPHVPPRPTVVQLQRCTVQVRVAYGQSETQLVRPIPLRPGGLQQSPGSPASSGDFRPVSPPAFGDSSSEHSDELVSSAEPSPVSPQQSDIKHQRHTTCGIAMKPAVPMSRRAPQMPVESNVDSETCGILQDPSCPTSQSFRPRSRSRSPCPPAPRSRTPTPQNTSPSRSPPFLSPKRQSPVSAPPLPPPSRNMDGTQQQKKDIYYV